jgi:type II secretory pathway pseudopilin PulG
MKNRGITLIALIITIIILLILAGITFLYTMNSTEKQYEISITSSGKVSATLSSEEVIVSGGNNLPSTSDNETKSNSNQNLELPAFPI